MTATADPSMSEHSRILGYSMFSRKMVLMFCSSATEISTLGHLVSTSWQNSSSLRNESSWYWKSGELDISTPTPRGRARGSMSNPSRYADEFELSSISSLMTSLRGSCEYNA